MDHLEVTAGKDMDSWTMPVRALQVSFEGFKPVDNTSLAKNRTPVVSAPCASGIKLNEIR